MKKVCLLIAFFCVGLWSLNAQIPNQFSYQAIARNTDGTPLSKTSVKIKFTILKNGATIFEEEKDITSNEFGIINHNIGSVKNIPSLINPPYRIKVDFGNGIVSESDLLSVPHALVADTVLKAPRTAVALTAGAGISIVGTTITNTGDIDATNEIQALSIVGSTITLSKNGGSVTVPTGLPSADAQTLSLLGNRLAISNGNSVDLTPYLDNTDRQTLSIVGNQLSILNGNSITLPTGGGTVTTDNTLTGNGTTTTPLSIKDAGITAVKLAPMGATQGQVLKWNATMNKWNPETDLVGVTGGVQTLTANAGRISLSNGGGDITLGTGLSATNNVLSVQIPNLGAASGDLTGTYPTLTVKSIQGKPFDFSTAPTNGQFIKWNGTSWTAGDVTNTDSWTSASGNIYRSTGNVGIGLTTPTDRLHVDGNFKLEKGDISVKNNLGKEAVRITTMSAPESIGEGRVIVSNKNGEPKTFLGTTTGGDAGYFHTLNNVGKIMVQISSGSTFKYGYIGLINTDDPTLSDKAAMYVDRLGVSQIYADNIIGNKQIYSPIIKAVELFPDVPSGRDIGNTDNKWKTIWLTTPPTVGSDRKLKDNIKTTNYGLSDILKLRPVSYHLKKDELKQTQIGFIAQEVEPIIPEIVVKPAKPEEFYAMRYEQLIPILTKAIQEQQDIINDLKKTVSEVKAKNDNLQKGMENLESKLDTVLKRLNIEERNPATGGTEGGVTFQLQEKSKKQN